MTAVSTGVALDKTIEPFIELRKFISTTIASRCLMVHDLVYDAFYTNAIKTRSVDQVKQILKDCNEYLARNNCTIFLLQPVIYSSVQPWLKGYNGQQNALFGS